MDDVLKLAPQQVSSVERWHDLIKKQAERGVGPTAIYDHLRLTEPDFAGTLSAVKRACTRLRRERGVTAEEVAIRVETPPGHVAQVDFGYAGKLYDPREGRERRAWFFVMTLGCSRHIFAPGLRPEEDNLASGRATRPAATALTAS